MSSTRWRKSTQVFVGFAVLAFVAAVVAAAAFFTMGNHGTSGARATVPPPRPPTVKPGIVPVADTAAIPSAGGLAAVLAPVAADPNLGKLGGRITDAMTGKELWQMAGRRAVGAGVDQQSLDGGRGAADTGPPGPDQHTGGGGQPKRPGARRAGGRRGSDAVGGATGASPPGIGVRRGSVTWSNRCGAAA